MADPVTDPVAEHDARYGEEGAGPPEGRGPATAWRVPGSPGSRRRGRRAARTSPRGSSC